MKASFTIPLLLSSLAASTQAITVRYCSNADFGGLCRQSVVSKNVCFNVPASTNDKISSVDTYGAHCIFYKDRACQGPSFRATGKKPRIPANMNDKVSSIKCT